MKFKGLFEDRDAYMRKKILDLYGVPEEIRQLDEYERCYNGKLFEDATYEWHQDWDQFGEKVKRQNKMPDFKDPIGKEIVDTLSSNVFGHNNFPEINFKTRKDIYPDRDLIAEALHSGTLSEEDVEDLTDAEKRKLKINLCNDELQRMVSDLFPKNKLMIPMLESSRKGVCIGKCIVTYTFIEGEVYYNVIDWKYVSDIKMHDRIPNRIIEFTEMYQFQEKDKKDPTKIKTYWHKHKFTENEEIIYHPAEHHDDKDPSFRIKDKITHNFGRCPAVIAKTPNGKSVFEGQVDNIKSYTYLTNDILIGLTRNMNPQYVLLENDPKEENIGLGDAVNNKPKTKGAIWKFMGKDVKALAHSTNGYSEGRELRKDLRSEILKASRCRILDVEMDNEESGVALSMKMTPDAAAIGEYRISFGDNALLELVMMIYNSAKKLSLKNEFLNCIQDFVFPEEDYFKTHLIWGDMTPPTEDKIMKAITNSLTAYKGGIIDLDHAVKRIAKYFDVMDVEDLIRVLKKSQFLNQNGEDAKQLYGRLFKEVQKKNQEILGKTEKESKGVKGEKENKSKYLQEKQ